MPLPLNIMLQMADSALPTGAFAYSNGLEALARAGAFVTPEDLEAHLRAHLTQALAFDLAFVTAAGAATDPGALDSLNAKWDAGLWNAGVRTASLRQARALIDLLAGLFPSPGLDALRTRNADTAREPLHYAIAFGHALALLGADAADACRLYLHGLVRDQAAAAVRLGIVGPRLAQGMQARATAAAMTELGDATGIAEPRNARRTAPAVETGQGLHGFLYSRLFQN